MNSFRKLVGVFVTLILATLAIPAIAQPAKTFSFKMEQDSLLPGKVIAYITNLSIPDQGTGGTTNVGSLVITVDPTLVGLQIADPSVPNNVKLERCTGPITGTLTCASTIAGAFALSNPPNGPSQLAITSLSQPLKGQETLKVTMSVLSCGFGSKWSIPLDGSGNSRVYNSGNLSGQTFTQTNSYNQTTDVSCATLACGGTTAVSRVDQYASSVQVTRGPFNSDGACADAPRIYVDNRAAVPDDSTTAKDDDKSVSLVWPFTGNQGLAEAAFRFDFTVASPINTPRLAWKNYFNGSIDTGIPAFLAIASDPALTCGSSNGYATSLPQPDYFPRPYGTLAAAVAPGDSKIKVTTVGSPAGSVAWPTTLPANLIIEDELMIVTKITVSNGTWTVTRPHPATTTYSATTPVMYTPLHTLSAAADPVCIGYGSQSYQVGHPTAPAFTCPYSKSDLAKACQVPDGSGVMGIGDPIFSGGQL